MPQTEGGTHVRWFLRPVTVIAAVLIAGPLAIPLVWVSPSFTKLQKALLTIAVIAATAWMLKSSADIYQRLLQDLRELQTTLQ